MRFDLSPPPDPCLGAVVEAKSRVFPVTTRRTQTTMFVRDGARARARVFCVFGHEVRSGPSIPVLFFLRAKVSGAHVETYLGHTLRS